MSTSHDDGVATPREPRAESTDDSVVARTSGEPPELLTLLDDEYARRILGLLSEASHRGRELSDRCGFSRPTVYRRLNRLEDAGLVRSELRLDPDGNHCKEFFLARDSLRISFDDGTLTVAAHSEAVDAPR
jgi:DNA-binding transcriptional ArsR family regulator